MTLTNIQQRETTNMIKVICAWCSAVLHEGSDDRISHGICEACLNKFLEELT